VTSGAEINRPQADGYNLINLLESVLASRNGRLSAFGKFVSDVANQGALIKVLPFEG
jgi:hypothetical protein